MRYELRRTDTRGTKGRVVYRFGDVESAIRARRRMLQRLVRAGWANYSDHFVASPDSSYGDPHHCVASYTITPATEPEGVE